MQLVAGILFGDLGIEKKHKNKGLLRAVIGSTKIDRCAMAEPPAQLIQAAKLRWFG